MPIIIIIFWLVLINVSFAQNQTNDYSATSLQHILNHTYNTHPTILDGLNAVKISLEDMNQVRANWKPTITLNASTSQNYTSTKNTNASKTYQRTSPDDLSLLMQYNLYNGGSDEARYNAQEQVILQTKTNHKLTSQQILLSTIQAYLTLALSQKRFALQQQSHEYFKQTLDVAKNRFALGDIRRTEVVQAEARLASSLASLTNAENDIIRGKAALYTLSQIDVGDAILDIPKANIDLPNSLSEAIDLAYQQNLTIESRLYELNISKFQEDRAAGDFLPDVNLTASHRHEHGATSVTRKRDTTALTISVSVPLYQAGVANSRLLQSNYRRGSAEYNLTNTKREIQQEITNLWSDISRLKTIEDTNNVAISTNKIALDAIQQEASLGTGTTLDILNARRDLLDAQIAAVTTQHNQLNVYYRMLFLLGELSADNFGIISVYD